MALAKVLSCAVVGLDGELVDVEVDIAQGMPAFAIVGLPDAAVQEAKERVRIVPARTLAQLMAHLSGAEPIDEFARDGQPPAPCQLWEGTDFGEVRGQEHVKRALEVAAGGGHNVLTPRDTVERAAKAAAESRGLACLESVVHDSDDH